jgi:hypothetical protein
MKHLLTDLVSLVKNNWKTIFTIVLVFYFMNSYSDIKLGIMDGWMGK